MERVLCTFSNSNSAWADRHCSSPAEQDTHNVFDHSDDNNNNNNNHGDADDGDAHDTTKDPRNSTEEEDEETEETRAPTPGPVFLDDENNNNNGTGNNDLPLCQSNQAGEFWVSQEAKRNTARTKIVSFAYQVQGTIDLNVDLLRTIVLPQLERELATALIPELFAPQQCQLTMAQLQQQQQQLATFAREEKVQQSSSLTSSQSLTIYGFEAMESDNVDPDGNNNLIRGRHRRQLTSFANGPADAPVTGMQPIPDDVLLPNYEGVRCRTELVAQAERCFILTGAYSLSGPRDVAWAVPVAQRATERVLNQHHALDDAHPLVKHVLYLDAVSPEEQPWLFDRDGGLTTPPVLIDTNIEQQDARRISVGWSWVVVAASISIVVCALALLLWRRRRRNDDDDDESASDRCWNGRRTRRHPDRITRGYMAYPSPDPSPRKQSIWMAENPAVPSSDDDYYISNNTPSWGEEPVSSFDPIFTPAPMLGSTSDARNGMPPQFDVDNVNDAEDPPHDNYLLHDGSFPVAFPPDIPPPAESVIDPHDDDGGEVAFAASFCDDDDDDDDDSGKWRAAGAASPDSGWLRDLV